jgi:hypothetical protein
LAIDPSNHATLYAGTDSEGAFKSTDSGASWTAINSGLPDLTVNVLAIDPMTPSTLYASVYGDGVFKSTDGGGHWADINSGLTYLQLLALAIDPTTPSTLYAGSFGSGVFKSTDGGGHWAAINNGLTGLDVNALAINPATPATLYAGTLTGAFRSTNGGASWTAIGLAHGGGVNALAIDPAHPTIVYAASPGGVFRSSDGGSSWLSTNSGLTGVPISAFAIDPFNTDTLYGSSSSHGVFTTSNSGGTWTAINTGLTNLSVTALAIDPTASSMVYAATQGGVFVLRAASTTPCVPDDEHMCLNSGRFRVEATWRRPTGETGAGHTVALTPDTGYLWFFSDSNVEAVIKVLDACAVNGNFWVFAAGLTNVQTTITITDSLTNTTRVYTNPQSTPFQPIQDTAAFPTCGTRSPANPPAPSVVGPPLSTTQSTSSQPDLLLRGGRFLVHAAWTRSTGETGVGTGVAITGDTGYFWFFSAANVELILKVLDGCALNHRNWVFAGGLTDVKVVITVTDTLFGETATFTNPQGQAFVPIQETQTGLISTTCLPRCSGSSFTSATITKAVDSAIAGLQAPFGDDFGRALAQISDQLQCGIIDEAAALLARSIGRQPAPRRARPMTDPVYDPNVDYCGPGDSTNSLLVMPTGDTCVNRACHAHDFCYQEACIAKYCYFCPHSNDAALCDQGLSDACFYNCSSLSILDIIVCTLVKEIPIIQFFNPLCSGPPCPNGQVCDPAIGQCGGPPCDFSLSATSQSFGPSSNVGSVSVTETGPHCTWTTVSADNWITVLPPSSNIASATVTYVLEANLGSASRTGTIYIADSTYTVTQAGATSCSYAIDSTGQSFAASGGSDSVNVIAPSGCPWTAMSNDDFITITSDTSGSGTGPVGYSVSANQGTSQRTGTMTIAGLTFTVTQAAGTPSCSYALSAPSQSFPSTGGAGSVNVSAPSGCPWTAVSNNNWITITSVSSPSGDGTVNYSVAANPGSSQQDGSMTIAGVVFPVTEDGATSPCSSVQVAGGDAPETHVIEMGQSSGTFSFYYQTYSIPDEMVVSYQGTVLFDTGCVGQENTVDLTYSGSATTIVVQVTPDCDGSSSGTAWTFTVGCPH